MKDLHDKETSIEFYDARYEQGYMEEWEEEKKKKVREIIKSIGLPEKGKLLDFGCGNGVFTNILKECLPSWEVYGVEISKIAVANAKRKYSGCTFFWADDDIDYKQQFDFLFSHHVIEHVQDLNETFATINSYLKPTAHQLHILPCGNEGSLEFNISQLIKNGIEVNKGNRFFFEESGHLRRLQTVDFESYENSIGFHLKKSYYANQYDGAVNWITKSSPRFVKKLTNYKEAVDTNAAIKLKKIRKKLLPLAYLQFPYSKYWTIKSKWKKSAKDYIKLSALIFPSLFSKILFEKLEKAASKEWENSKQDPQGSEMFLYFKRGD